MHFTAHYCFSYDHVSCVIREGEHLPEVEAMHSDSADDPMSRTLIRPVVTRKARFVVRRFALV